MTQQAESAPERRVLCADDEANVLKALTPALGTEPREWSRRQSRIVKRLRG